MSFLPPGSADEGRLGEHGLQNRPTPSGKLKTLAWQSEDFTEELRARLAAIERKIDALGGLRDDAAGAPPRMGGRLSAAFLGMEKPLQPPPLVGGGESGVSDSITAGEEDTKSMCQPDEQANTTPMAAASTLAISEEQGGAAAAGAGDAAEKEARRQVLSKSRSRTAWQERSRTAWSEFEEEDVDNKAAERERSRVTWSATRETLPQAKHLLKKLGFGKTMETMRLHLDDPSSMRGWQWIHSPWFYTVCSVMIVMNAFFIGFSSNATLKAELRDLPPPSGLIVIEVLFAAFFLCELVLRAMVERWLFFVGPEFKWNIFDLALVIMSIVDLLMYITGSSASANLTLGRLFRVFRFFRLARLSRVIRQFGSLRLVLYAILDSMSSLFWCFVVIGLAIYVFAVLFLSAAAEHFQSVGGSADDETSRMLRSMYGNLTRTFITLFMVISGGIDWGDAMRPLAAVHGIYMPIFIFYVFVMHFGVLNVVIGTFVATATEIAAKDREALVKYELRQWNTYTERIKTFFQEADLDKSGTLSWEEFREHLENQKVRAYFQTLDLDVSQAHVLFQLLDADGSNQVTIDEFLDGCMRLKGQAKSIDLNMLLYHSKKVFDQMSHFMRWTEQKCAIFEEQIGMSMPVDAPADPLA